MLYCSIYVTKFGENKIQFFSLLEARAGLLSKLENPNFINQTDLTRSNLEKSQKNADFFIY